MSSVLTPSRRGRRPPVNPVLLAIALASALGLFALLRWVIPSVPVVDHITVANPTPYTLEVEVKGAGDHAWLGLGTVERDRTARFDQVTDQGKRWIFRFTSAGERGGEVTVPRQQLEAERWRLRVPDEVGHRLAAAGLPPSPAG